MAARPESWDGAPRAHRCAEVLNEGDGGLLVRLPSLIDENAPLSAEMRERLFGLIAKFLRQELASDAFARALPYARLLLLACNAGDALTLKTDVVELTRERLHGAPRQGGGDCANASFELGLAGAPLSEALSKDLGALSSISALSAEADKAQLRDRIERVLWYTRGRCGKPRACPHEDMSVHAEWKFACVGFRLQTAFRAPRRLEL